MVQQVKRKSLIEEALELEGISGAKAEVIKSIYAQESGSGRNTKTSNQGAVGGMQIIPSTFASVADKGWDINDPLDNARAGIRYASIMYDKAGGDPVLTGAGYYGGEGGLNDAKKGVARRDKKNPNAPDTLQYGKQIASRLSGDANYQELFADTSDRGEYLGLESEIKGNSTGALKPYGNDRGEYLGLDSELNPKPKQAPKEEPQNFMQRGLTKLQDVAGDVVDGAMMELDGRTLADKGMLKQPEADPNATSNAVPGVPYRKDYVEGLQQQARVNPLSVTQKAILGDRAAEQVSTEAPANAEFNDRVAATLNNGQERQDLGEMLTNKRKVEQLAKVKAFQDQLAAGQAIGNDDNALRGAVAATPDDEDRAAIQAQITANEKYGNIPTPEGFDVVANAAGRAMKQGSAMAQNMVGWTADVVGADDFALSMLRNAAQTQDEAGQYPAAIKDFTQIKSWSDVPTYVLEGVIENAGMLIGSMGAGALGMKLGEKTLTKAAAAKLTEDVAKRELARRAAIGSAAGASAASIGMETGSIYGDIFQETGKREAGLALGGGVVAGALDAIPATMALKTMLGKRAGDEAVKSIVQRYGVDGLKQLTAEGATEYAQTWIELATQSQASGKDLFTDENAIAALDAAFKGGAAGAATHIVAQGANDLMNRQKAVADRVRTLPDKNLDTLRKTAAQAMPQDLPIIDAEIERRKNMGTLAKAAEAPMQQDPQGAAPSGVLSQAATLAPQPVEQSGAEAINIADILGDENVSEQNAIESSGIPDTFNGNASVGSPAINSISGNANFSSDINNLAPVSNLAKDEIKVNNEFSNGSGNASSSESFSDGSFTNTKSIADIIDTPAFKKNGFSGLDVPSQRSMLASVVGLIQNNKIGNDVIGFAPVYMMDVLSGKKLSAEEILHNESMLSDVLSVYANKPVPLMGDSGSSLESIPADGAAKMDITSGNSGFREPKTDSATIAGDKSAATDGFVMDGSAGNPAEKESILTNFAGASINGSTANGTIDIRHDVTPNSNVVLGAGEATTSSAPSIISNPEKNKSKPKPRAGTLLAKLRDIGGVNLGDKLDVTGERRSFTVGGYNQVFKANSPNTLRGLIESGDLDDFLPYNMRLQGGFNDDAFDSEPAYDYLSERIRNGDRVLSYEVEEEARANKLHQEDGADAQTDIDELVELFSEDEINEQLRIAGNQEREATTEARQYDAPSEDSDTGSSTGREESAPDNDNRREISPAQTAQRKTSQEREGIRPLVEALTKRRAAASQMGASKLKVFNTALDHAKKFLNGEEIKPIKFTLPAAQLNGDPPLSDILKQLAELAKPAATQVRKDRNAQIESFKTQIAEAKDVATLKEIGEAIKDMGDRDYQMLDDLVLDAIEALENARPKTAEKAPKNSEESSNGAAPRPDTKTTDLLGDDTRSKQAIADAEAAKDAKRNSGNGDSSGFVLTGSNSEADQAAAAGAQDLFAEPAKAAPVNESKAKAQKDLNDALSDLGDIFGANFRANITPEQEQKLIPVITRVMDAAFRLGYENFKSAAKFVLDTIRAKIGDSVADQITLDQLQGSYIAMAGKYGDKATSKKEVINVDSIDEIKEYQHVTDERSSPNMESNSQDANAKNSVGAQGVSNEPGRNDRVRESGVSNTESQARPSGSNSVLGRETPIVGERGNSEIHTRISDAEASAFRDSISERSGNRGIDGAPVEPEATERINEVAQGGLFELESKVEQKKADKIPQELSLENIRATLPILKPGQQEDVFKAETRFDQDDGYGMLFTNGTGTGKTFTGLGVIKRFVNRGKDNVLIVVPSDKIMDDWQQSGKLLGLQINALENTKDAGKGVTITTYANFGDNKTLADRNWDLVVNDEAHYLMMNEAGETTNALNTLRAVTNHPDASYYRFQMLYRAQLDEIAELSKQLQDTIEKGKNPLLSDAEAEANDKENDRLSDLLSAKEKARNEFSKKVQEDVKAAQGKDRTRALFLSATPWAYEKNVDWANGYLFDYGAGKEADGFRSYNTGTNRAQFFMENFGYRMRYNRLTEPDAKVNRGLMQRQFNTRLKKAGVLSGRMLEVDADYDRKFVLIDSAIGRRIDSALEWFRNQRDALGSSEGDNELKRAYYDLESIINDSFDFLSKRYLLEAIKAKAVIPMIKQHLALGRKIVVFHDYKKGGGFNPFNVSRLALPKKGERQSQIETFDRVLEEFNREFMDLINADDFKSGSPIQTFQQAFPNARVFNGDVPKKLRREAVMKFQDDKNVGEIMLVQSAAGKEGISLHDTTGKYQRVLFNLGQPTQPTTAIQQEGRTYRTGQVSNAMFRYLNTGTNWERWTFAQTIATRASTAENLAMGEQARALKDAFITAFEESDTYPAGHEGEGTGGKERDKAANNVMTEFDRAKSFYYGTQKKNARTKEQEGKDYYATPEPIGLKMVEFADIRGGEKVLEPSAGHGAIARWAPENAERTAIEPSYNLRPRLAMVFDGKILGENFEDHHIVNKYDAIVMNPPFGSGGKTAVDHVAKAAQHLNDGGRIVALIPDGGMTDKRFDKWFYEKATRPIKPLLNTEKGDLYAGDTVVMSSWNGDFEIKDAVVDKVNGTYYVRMKGSPLSGAVISSAIKSIKSVGARTEEYSPAEGLHLVGSIKLPSVTFERAATSVRTRILVIEKTSAPPAAMHRDYSDIDDINDLFDRIESFNMQPRSKPEDTSEAEETAPVRQPATSAVKEADKAALEREANASVASDGESVTFEIRGDKLITNAPAEKVVTGKGKELTGVFVTDGSISLAEIKNVDKFTYYPRGRSAGAFVRLRHVERPDGGDSEQLYSRNDTKSGISITAAQSIIDELQTKYPNLPQVKLVDSQNKMPIAQKDRTDLYNKDGAALDKADDIAGLYYKGEIWLNTGAIASEQHFREVFAHEAIGHYSVEKMLNEVDPSLVGKLVNQVNTLHKIGNKYISRLVAEVNNNQPGLSETNRAKEVIALIAEYGDQNLDRASRSLWQRIIDGIKAFAKLVFDVDMSDNDVRDIVAMAERHAKGHGSRDAMQSIYAKGEMFFSRTTSTKAAYEKRIDELFNGGNPNREGVKVLDRTDVLDMLGYGDKPLVLAESKVNKKVNGVANHPNITAEHWKKVPEWLENPAAVFDSDTETGVSLVFVAPELLNGAPIIMVIEPDVTQNNVAIDLLKNNYDKDSGKVPVGRWVRDGLLKYIDKAKSRDFLTTSKLQLFRVLQEARSSGRKILVDSDLVKYRANNPANLSRSTLPDTITVDGIERPTLNSNGKPIHPTREGVEKFWKWFGDSKVVDADGKPLAVYHGTDKNFNTFDKSQKGIMRVLFSEFDVQRNGFFFATSEDGAQNFGKNIIPAFLSIKKPADFTNIKIDKELIEAGLDKNDLDTEFGNVWELFDDERGSRVVSKLKELGYDGVKFLEDGAEEGMEQVLSYMAFEPNQIKSATQNTGDFNPANQNILYSRNPQATLQPQWESLQDNKFDDIRYLLQDQHIDLKRVRQKIKEAGNDIADRWDAYLQEELYHGRTAKRVKDFINNEVEPLIKDMQARGVSMADFETYLHNRHAEERNIRNAAINPEKPDGGSGIYTADARKFLADLTQEQKQNFEALAKHVDAMVKGSNQVLVDYDLESAGTIQQRENSYQYYVPLHREEMETDGNGTGQGYSVRGGSTKRAFGSDKNVVNILSSIVEQREINIVRGEKNRVATALVGMAKLNPNDDFWEVDTPPTKKVVSPITGQMERVVDPTYKSHPNVVVARVRNKQGEIIEKSVVFNKFNPRAKRAAAAMKNLELARTEEWIESLAKVTRYFSSVNTQYNPIFGVLNIVRDVQGSMLNLSTTPLKGRQKEVSKNIIPALKGIYQDIRSIRAGNGSTNSEWAQLFEEFQNEGGQTGYRDMYANATERGEALKKALDPQWWTKTKIGRFISADGKLADYEQFIKDKTVAKVFDWLSDYNETLENATRLAVYKVAKDQGLTNAQAASIAKNISVNFNRKGTKARMLGSFYAFFNAAMQGSARIGETLTGEKGKQIIIGGISLGAMQALALAAAGYDDDEPPEFVRDRNLIIPLDMFGADQKYITVPMPLGFNALPNFGRIVTEYILSGFKDPIKRMAHLFEMTLDVTNPIGGSGDPLNIIAPTAVDPIVDLGLNKDFTGRPIAIKDFNSLAPTAGHTRAKDSASAIGRGLSYGINWLNGGTDYTPGVIVSPTPDQIDYLIGQAFGGVGRESIKLNQSLNAAITGEYLPPHKLPLVGRFYGDAAGQSAQSAKFYSNIQELNRLETEIKGRQGDGLPVDAFIRENPKAKLIWRANQLERFVSQQRKVKRDLIKRGAAHKEIEAVDAKMTEQMAILNKMVEKIDNATN